jgi:hypothetical protein
MDWGTLIIGGILLLTLTMFCEVAAFGALLGLGYQGLGWLQTGKWAPHTLALDLKLAADPQWTHWVMVDRFIHYVLFDVELAVVVLAAALCVSPIKQWLERAPTLSSASAPATSLQHGGPSGSIEPEVPTRPRPWGSARRK